MPESPLVATFLEGSVSDLLASYRSGQITPEAVIDYIVTTSAAMAEQPHLDHSTKQGKTANLSRSISRHRARQSAPLGVPFAVKDNIDVAGMPTTAACPDYAYQPTASAFAVQCLIDAGAIPVGKTNLDQFATGLVGVRSPYGVPINPAYQTAYPAAPVLAAPSP